MNEKQAIERATADAFLTIYNSEFETSYKIVEHSDAPDVLCEDESGQTLNLEITLTEDREGDIPALLGRSEARSFEALEARRKAVENGEASPSELTDCFPGNVSDMILQRIQAKLSKDYGPDTALIIRDTSRLPWDWELVVSDLRSSLDLGRNRFDRGIWIYSHMRKRIFRVD